METQTRPTYAKWADLSIIVHENAHCGDSVTVKSWADICLNECFAPYAQWLWAEAKDGSDLDDRYRCAVEMPSKSTDFWAPKLTGMGPGHEFEGVYDKGILAMQALRRRIGDDAFYRMLSGRPAQFKGRQRFVGGVRALRHQPVRAEHQRVLRRLVPQHKDPGRRRPLPRTPARLKGTSGT